MLKQAHRPCRFRLASPCGPSWVGAKAGGSCYTDLLQILLPPTDKIVPESVPVVKDRMVAKCNDWCWDSENPARSWHRRGFQHFLVAGNGRNTRNLPLVHNDLTTCSPRVVLTFRQHVWFISGCRNSSTNWEIFKFTWLCFEHVMLIWLESMITHWTWFISSSNSWKINVPWQVMICLRFGLAAATWNCCWRQMGMDSDRGIIKVGKERGNSNDFLKFDHVDRSTMKWW